MNRYKIVAYKDESIIILCEDGTSLSNVDYHHLTDGFLSSGWIIVHEPFNDSRN